MYQVSGWLLRWLSIRWFQKLDISYWRGSQTWYPLLVFTSWRHCLKVEEATVMEQPILSRGGCCNERNSSNFYYCYNCYAWHGFTVFLMAYLDPYRAVSHYHHNVLFRLSLRTLWTGFSAQCVSQCIMVSPRDSSHSVKPQFECIRMECQSGKKTSLVLLYSSTGASPDDKHLLKYLYTFRLNIRSPQGRQGREKSRKENSV